MQPEPENTIPEKALRLSRVAVSVERHLQSELELLDKLDHINQTLASALNESGTNGLTLEQSRQLERKSDRLISEADSIRVSRKKVLDLINEANESTQNPLTIRQFIQTLAEPTRSRLEANRFALLDRLTDIHANMLGNQAVMFYTYDFNRKLVSSLLGTEKDDNRYSVDGQSAGIKPGNLIQRAC